MERKKERERKGKGGNKAEEKVWMRGGGVEEESMEGEGGVASGAW